MELNTRQGTVDDDDFHKNDLKRIIFAPSDQIFPGLREAHYSNGSLGKGAVENDVVHVDGSAPSL